MAEFATVKANELQFGNSIVVEVARKVAIGESGAKTYVASILRGFVGADGRRRIKSSITFPFDPAILRWTSEQLAGIAVAAEATRDAVPDVVRADAMEGRK